MTHEPTEGPTATRLSRAVQAFGTRVEDSIIGDILSELRRVRIFDLAYTLSAQTFVALIPLVLFVTAAFAGTSDEAVAARELIERFGLSGAARRAVESLFQNPGAGSGLYWTGFLITLYSAFALSRRVARAYTTVWDVRPLPAREQWKGLVWIVLQVILIVAASSLRTLRRDRGALVQVTATIALVVIWLLLDFAVQVLLTNRQVKRSRLAIAAAFTCAGRLLVGLWSVVYLPRALTHQAEQYGSIGVVFSVFTYLFAVSGTLIVAILLAAVLTRRRPADWFTLRGRPER